MLHLNYLTCTLLNMDNTGFRSWMVQSSFSRPVAVGRNLTVCFMPGGRVVPSLVLKPLSMCFGADL
jgi:hypothetical protein